ncbi:MAG: cbb3-type cytochrome c oxidase subunit I [Chloroflexi bacterium]|nr:cbb3-type cytochrome c oxidase subunit I [Chloroflexota bacterium]
MTSTADARAGSPITAMVPLIRGLVWGLAAFAIGAGITALLRKANGHTAWSLEMNLTIGYAFGLPGWLFGVGVWERWGREWFGLEITAEEPTGLRRFLAFSFDHKVIGIQYLTTFLILFITAGFFAMLIRWQLLQPEGAAFSDGTYNRIMSLHGIIMIAVAVASVIGGFGNYFVPIMIGAKDVAFPRLNALTFWLVPPVAIMLLAAQAAGGWDSGWTAYPPLSTHNAAGQTFFSLAIITFGLSSILGGLNFLVTIIHLRAPGMSWGRLPVFVWAMFATSWLSLCFTQFFAAAMLMILLERIAGFTFFSAADGGAPLLYQHIFWFYSHPAVYIFVLPGLGITLEVLTHFSRKPLFAYRWAVGGLLGIVALSGIVWAHHMFVSGMDSRLLAPFLVTTEVISIPTGLVFLSALGTIWMGRLWLRTPMLFALGVIFNFLIGGITGIFLADVPTDISLSDTYYVVAHFHYTIIGGEIFALFAGIYYWFPKMSGRMYNEKLGQLHFWMMFLGFNATFIPMFWAGMHGMNRRIATYQPDLQGVNQVISVMAFCLGASFIVFIANMLYSVVRGPKAAADPWRARTLEWQVSSPPPLENFHAIPLISGNPYDYGVRGAPAHAIMAVAGGSGEDERISAEGVSQ